MAASADALVLTARWVVPVSGAALPGGRVTVRGGRIEAVQPRGERTADVDLGNAAILPGLVNAHTHLDLSGLRGACPPGPDFAGWLGRVIGHRRSTTPGEVQQSVRAGAEECLASGTTLVGDIAAEGQSWEVLAASPLRAVVFRELTGLRQERVGPAVTAARQWLADHPPDGRLRPGLSPHAPYSVRSSLFEGAGRLAGEVGCPLAVHLAESRAEAELLADRTGPFVPFLEGLGVWDPEGLVAGAAEVLRRLDRGVPLAVAHGNYLPADVALPRTASVVYCPRTHAAFGHEPHPFRAWLAAGVRVALGTDSLASNPDLDLLAEARWLHARYPDVPGAALVRMATLSGAEALGWEGQTGSLEAGKAADLVVLPLPAEDGADPCRLVLQAAARPARVMVAGEWVYPRPESTVS